MSIFQLRTYVSASAWQEVIGLLDAEVVPLLRKCSLAGHAEYKTNNEASIVFDRR